ncbi:hypothetical protein B0P06_006105 [Clostridium saccharoperbutylacetonicum]|uniref:DUF1565 domain-containing protein n=1 Tax=Clostridium saccharoperbutylacetonicum N1-4(HMT) TaxID=931276 RepID=M1M1X0_9CLOT|nr:hypothetical protein [Clostridium saccharoperbutylacetonicum]AGF59620.1 hypothetical protein Cspa_135p00600 [Clostridium saccharoperbutylacetonicum N1-4(HMT)]NRT64523.1 hypothetical protein [Clostridium saccharoperbutylacetonicum]NSB28998.1 hypothetical protein [Clostridium saccharoperbutylacetonicum]NSB46212.1 hypothetical protein [Clostridium saccharoperbutylacetonicum]
MNKKFYVSLSGSDTTGDGSKANPFATISFALTMITASMGEIDIYLSRGVHKMYAAVDMSLTTNVINYYGNGFSTVIEFQYCYCNAGFKNEMTINKCVVRPCNNYNGDVRAVIYTSDTKAVVFNNVFFTKSPSGVFPTEVLFYFHNNTAMFVCNKSFNSCSFFFDRGYPIVLGACTLNKCTTNYLGISSVPNNIETNSLYNQTYGFEFLLITGDNSLYGVYSGSNPWNGTKMFVLSDDGICYSCYNGTLIKTEMKYENGFNIEDFEFINDLHSLSPFKIVFLTLREYSSANIPISSNAFLLLNVLGYTYENIKTAGKHKMLFSNDLKTWFNYYDNKNYNKVYIDNIDNYFIRDYVINNCKYIDEIDTAYKYIYIHIEDNEIFNGFTEQIIPQYKKVDIPVNIQCGSESKATIVVPEHVTNLVVKKLTCGKENIIKDTMGGF